MQDVQALSAVVQKNCDISDARHARDFTMCVYLLRMREYYRWAKGYRVTDKLSREALGDWVMKREQLWDRLEPEDFECVPVGDGCQDPFETDAINRYLVPEGLVYSAGYGRFVKPHFFLGELLRREMRDGFEVLVSKDEFARDLVAPPAMTLGRQIFIRRDSLRRTLWERLEEWRWRKSPHDAMGRAIAYYDFDRNSERALDEMTDTEIASATLHEFGEGTVSNVLGPAWSEMMLSVAGTVVELQARAVRDLLVDCLVTLPTLFELRAEPSLHFFFANLKGQRKELFPALLAAYDHWLQMDDLGELERAAEAGRGHWLTVAGRLMEMQQKSEESGLQALEAYLEAQKLT